MSFLAKVSKGKLRQPLLVLLYGVDGVGKSTFASNAPSPVFLGPEDGTANLDVARFPRPTSFKDVLAAVQELTKEKHDFKTLVIDSIDWLEPLVWEQVCLDHDWKNIESPGYGKGYVVAVQYWRQLIAALGKLRSERGMNIIAIAHSLAKSAQDLQNQTEYLRYQLKLNDKAAALWREYVDVVLFANFATYTAKDAKGKEKRFADGTRVAYTEHRAWFDAKSRFKIPSELEFSFDVLTQEIEDSIASGESSEQIKSEISALISRPEAANYRDRVLAALEQAGEDISQLTKLKAKLASANA